MSVASCHIKVIVTYQFEFYAIPILPSLNWLHQELWRAIRNNSINVDKHLKHAVIGLITCQKSSQNSEHNYITGSIWAYSTSLHYTCCGRDGSGCQFGWNSFWAIIFLWHQWQLTNDIPLGTSLWVFWTLSGYARFVRT